MAKGFGKKDGIFLGIFSAVLILVCAGFYFLGRQPGAMAEVTVDGKFYGAYPLSQDQTVDIMKGVLPRNVGNEKRGDDQDLAHVEVVIHKALDGC